MRNIKDLHPALQEKINLLISRCEERGIKIGIGECLRTAAEQDALYAKGRTTAGTKVTNCKGFSYSSMHQWGVAFDFYIIMDVDGDGKTSDDAYNDKTGLFEKVGKIGQEIGLEWGGSWKSFKDLPHFQLPNWGSTASKLKAMYGTPDKFMRSWGGAKANKIAKTKKPTAAKNRLEKAKAKDKTYNHTYTTASRVNLRSGAGTGKPVITVIPKGDNAICYGYYTKVGDDVWLSVQYGKYQGYVCKRFLK